MNRYSASFQPFPLHFKKPAGTSRGFLNSKPTWIISVRDNEKNIEGLGECSIIPGLCIDPENEIEKKLQEVCNQINTSGNFDLNSLFSSQFPAINFAIESAYFNLKTGRKDILFDNYFSRGERGIDINGLVWMASVDDMFNQAKTKYESGFKCLKFKIGALDFEREIELLKRVRNELSDEIEIRLDANGAFTPMDALHKIEILSKFNIHSLEQPIKPGQWQEMRDICFKSNIPIVLDEELIGIDTKKAPELLETIQPAYIILKPSLTGGFSVSDNWIKLAEENNISWWATSALESNLGLNAIAQWVANKNITMPQGLGTGSLYIQNYPIDLEIKSGQLWFNSKG